MFLPVCLKKISQNHGLVVRRIMRRIKQSYIAFAVSPPSRWMTGTVLRMDGGEVKSV